MPIRDSRSTVTAARPAWSFRILIALLVVASVPGRSAQLLTSERLRLRVLQTAFPRARISRSTGPLEDLSLNLECCKELPLRDAFREEHLYEIVAPATKAEQDPASDVAEPEHPLSTRRLVRLQVYRRHSQNGRDPLPSPFSTIGSDTQTHRTAAKSSARYSFCPQMLVACWTASRTCLTLSACLLRSHFLTLTTVAWRSCFWLRTILLPVRLVSISKYSMSLV